MCLPIASVPTVPAPAAVPAQLLTTLALLMVSTVVALVAWALQLMQAASERREFALMLAGCMVCSAAVGLATVTVITITGPGRLEARALGLQRMELERGVSLDAVVLPWDQPSSAATPRS